VYGHCLKQPPLEPLQNGSANGTLLGANLTALDDPCTRPASYVGEDVMTNLWRVVYWTSQCLTWSVVISDSRPFISDSRPDRRLARSEDAALSAQRLPCAKAHGSDLAYDAPAHSRAYRILNNRKLP
jgi:hypothetical protein